tara:strand:- start:1138 stop:1326 length:189 start_codon:yes stop_codon:yes gene_type:complete
MLNRLDKNIVSEIKQICAKHGIEEKSEILERLLEKIYQDQIDSTGIDMALESIYSSIQKQLK